MSDLRERRCADLLDPVSKLTVAVVTCHEHSPQSFTEVIRAAEAVLAVADLGAYGVDDPDYAAWVAAAPAALASMIEAAQEKDKARVWAAFSDPQHGMHRVASACSGLPGWAPPVGFDGTF